MAFASFASMSAASWEIQSHRDKMDDKTTQSATVKSNNQLKFKFPYEHPDNRGEITIYNPSSGGDFFLSVSKGQFLCHRSSCFVKVKFDNNKPEYWQASPAASGRSDLIYVRGDAKLVQRARTAKKLLVEASFYQYGTEILEFDLQPLKWK